jgi:hypothetical protein
VVLSLPAKLAVALHGLFPGLTADAFGWLNRVLPGPGGLGTRAVPGAESESALTSPWLTGLTDRAARENNELGVQPSAARAVP